MEESIHRALDALSAIVWGPPLLALLVGTGVYLTWRLRFLQLRLLGRSLYLGLVVRKEPNHQPGDVTHFEALMTALAATVGTGNIAGVATAIAAGGPGAIFWMWVTGIFGMATKYAEALLAVRYRHQDASGVMSGGPMYYLRDGLGMPWLGTVFAALTAVAAFGIGNMVQSNSVADAALGTFGVPAWLTGILMATATALVILGGIQSIGRVAGIVVPLMIVFYVGAGLVGLMRNLAAIPEAFAMIFTNAFTPAAATGGFLGATVMRTIQLGVARGVFSNESGLGSAPIAAAAAQTSNPAMQAMVSMTQTFIDTIVVCTITALVILTSGAWSSGATGAGLTTAAFAIALPGDNVGAVVVAVSLILFAYSTLLGWSYYGEKAMTFLFGESVVLPYRAVFCVLIAVGAVAKLELVWAFADVMNGLMAVPNLIGLIGLTSVVVAETEKLARPG